MILASGIGLMTGSLMAQTSQPAIGVMQTLPQTPSKRMAATIYAGQCRRDTSQGSCTRDASNKRAATGPDLMSQVIVRQSHFHYRHRAFLRSCVPFRDLLSNSDCNTSIAISLTGSLPRRRLSRLCSLALGDYFSTHPSASGDNRQQKHPLRQCCVLSMKYIRRGHTDPWRGRSEHGHSEGSSQQRRQDLIHQAAGLLYLHAASRGHVRGAWLSAGPCYQPGPNAGGFSPAFDVLRP